MDIKSEKFKIYRQKQIKSKFLHRIVIFDLIVPSDLLINETLPFLCMNDGQDFEQLRLDKTYHNFYQKINKRHIYIGIHANEKRLSEYGTIGIPDYKNRGDLAAKHQSFILEELLPLIQKELGVISKPSENVYCGFSLGGLSAFDLAWENPNVFSKVAVFSGSFWWRDKSYEEGYDNDLDRILHKKVKKGTYKQNLKFWFECGTEDETADRNNNGIIDAIDDTLDLIKELKQLGYTDEALKYVEIKGGRHNFDTWRTVFPEFLEWAFTE
jgi:enterochelin esterase-like enzyme